MPEYKYFEQVERKIEAKPCPCCGGEDIKFYEANMDESVMSEHASVTCRNCGHEVYVKGRYDIHHGSGRACLLQAIRDWDAQYNLYQRKRLPYEDEEDKLKLLKTLLEGFRKTELIRRHYENQDCEIYDKDAAVICRIPNAICQIIDDLETQISQCEQTLATARGELQK